MSWLRLYFDRNLDASAVEDFLQAVLTSQGLDKVVFDVARRDGETQYRIGTVYPVILSSLIDAHLPNVIAVRAEPLHGALIGWQLKASSTRRSLDVSHPERATASLLGALALARSDVALQRVHLGRRLAPQAIDRSAPMLQRESFVGQLFEAATVGNRPLPVERATALQAKQSSAGAACVLEVMAPRSLIPAFEAHWRSLQSPGLHLGLKPAGLFKPREVALNSAELLTVIGWPIGERSYPGLDRTGARTASASSTSRTGRFVAHGNHPGDQGDLRLTIGDGLRHLHVLGPTGTGKSTLLLNMISQDIEAGTPTVVLDPKGDLIDDLLGRIPDDQLDRVVVLDPTRTDFIVGFNPLAGAADPELAVDALVNIFQVQYAASWGPRTQDVLHSALLTLAQLETGTINAVPQLLMDAAFRRTVLSQVAPGEHLALFWSGYEALSDPERARVIAPVLNKLRPLLLRTGLRSMLGSTKPFDMERVFSENLVLLVPLRKGLTGPGAANLLGGLVVAELWQAILRRGRVSSRRRRPAAIYLDEFQDYTSFPTDLADVLAQARGLGAGMVLAHQNLAQLNPDLRATVMANAQSRIAFRLGVDDARVLAQQTPNLDAHDFMSLEPFSIYAQLLRRGQKQEFASGTTVAAGRRIRDYRRAAKSAARRWGNPPLPEKPPPSRDDQAPPEDIGRKRGRK